MSDRRHPCLIPMLVVLVCLAGCASSQGGQGASSVRVVHDKSALGNDAAFVDVHIFRVDHSRRGEMNRIARDYVHNLGADVALVRVTDDAGPYVLFSVEAYRRVRGGD